MKYETDQNNHQDWLNKGPWYNKSICLKLHGSMFGDFITRARTDRYNLMCYLVAHDKLQQDYKDDESSIGDMSIPDNATPKSLEALFSMYHPPLLQEWRLNIDAAEYKSNIDANLYKPSEKKKIHCVDNSEHCPTSIKETILWFTFLTII